MILARACVGVSTSPSPSSTRQPESTSSSGRTAVTTDQQLQHLFGALHDADCRRIIEATNETTLTAKEVSDDCELPLSTAYRKLDTLVQSGLLEERCRLPLDGRHVREYSLLADGVSVSLGGENGVQASLSPDSDIWSQAPPEANKRERSDG